MSKKINVKDAKKWSDEEFEANVKFLEDRSRYKQADELKAARSKSTKDGSNGSSAPKSGNRKDVTTWLEDDDPPTVDQVLDWVGDDPKRATMVLAIESNFQDPRTTLLEPLEQMTKE